MGLTIVPVARLAADIEGLLEQHRATADTGFLGQEGVGAGGPAEARTAPAVDPASSGQGGETTLTPGSDGAFWLSPGSVARAPGLGRYLLRDLLGVGGVGVVFSAYDPELDRRVAIKLVSIDQDEARTRLAREAQAMARLSHPNVVTVHEVIRVGESAAIVMQLIDGPNLETWQANSRLLWREILAVYLQAAQGLAAAHGAGLVHRDFKPSNALLDAAGVVHVTDFGLARETGATGDSPRAPYPEGSGTAFQLDLTRTGAVMGTPLYMAPEQHLGAPIDARTDQWAFACSLYEALYRQHPFAHGDPSQLRSQVVGGLIRREPRGSAVPRQVRAAIRRALSPSAAQRFASMDEMVAALSLAPPRSRRWIANGALAALALGALLIGPVRRALSPVPGPGPSAVQEQLDPARWRKAGSRPDDYATGVSKASSAGGQSTASITATAANAPGFGTLMQSLSAEPYVIKRIRLSASIRAQGVSGWAGLWMRVDGNEETLAFDNMQDRPIKGTTGWNRYETILDVAPEARGLAFGVLLVGSGTVFIKGVELVDVGADTPTSEVWLRYGPDPLHYETGVAQRDGAAVVEYIKSTVPDPGSIALAHSVDARLHRGRMVRISGYLAGEGLAGKAGLWVRIDGRDQAFAFDCADCRPIVGSAGWGEYQGLVRIPSNAGRIQYGVFVEGTGRLLFKEVRVRPYLGIEPVSSASDAALMRRLIPPFRVPVDETVQPMAPRPTSSLRGRLVDDVTGRPIAGVRLVLEGGRKSSFTDPNGRFVFNNLPLAKPFSILVVRDGHNEELDEGRLPDSETTVDIGTRRLLKIDWNKDGWLGGERTRGLTGIENQMRDGKMVVTAIRTGYPAERAGIHPGDRVLSIDGRSMDSLSHESRSYCLMGKPGTRVTVEVEEPSGDTRTVVLVRQGGDAPLPPREGAARLAVQNASRSH
jgi:serine/threonine protein kinase